MKLKSFVSWIKENYGTILDPSSVEDHEVGDMASMTKQGAFPSYDLNKKKKCNCKKK